MNHQVALLWGRNGTQRAWDVTVHCEFPNEWAGDLS